MHGESRCCTYSSGLGSTVHEQARVKGGFWAAPRTVCDIPAGTVLPAAAPSGCAHHPVHLSWWIGGPETAQQNSCPASQQCQQREVAPAAAAVNGRIDASGDVACAQLALDFGRLVG